MSEKAIEEHYPWWWTGRVAFGQRKDRDRQGMRVAVIVISMWQDEPDQSSER